MTELWSSKGAAYEGSLSPVSIKIPSDDWSSLKAYAKDNGTSAGEVIRTLVRELLAGVEAASSRAIMDARRLER